MKASNATSPAAPLTNAPGQVHVSVENRVAWLRLDNPSKHNAVSLAMWDVLVAALERFATDDEVRCVVITGQGEAAFCAGADLEEKAHVEHARGHDEQERLTIAALARVQAFPKPVIAMVRGYCLGAGVALAVSCDLRIASNDARFGITAAKLGLPYYFEGMKRLCDLVGPSSAKRIIFTADRLPSDDALRIGLVDQVVDGGDLHATVAALAMRIAANAPLPIAAAKYAVETLIRPDGTPDVAGCHARDQACRDSEDHLEGLRAFTQKRPPVFRGR